MRLIILCVLLLGGAIAQSVQNDLRTPAKISTPDDRYKTDILLVVAHPDDDTAVSSYLARAVFDEARRVAVVFTTRGEGGGNDYGYETGKALGYIRENEARRALAAFDVQNVWFLDGKNNGGGVLNSLASWPHGEGLESLVRLIRLTRPEVMLTQLPASLPGEHSDHQAAGVVATEAFGLAGNPTIFPEQVSLAITPSETAHHGRGFIDGLRPWQAKKLYFVLRLARIRPQWQRTTLPGQRHLPEQEDFLREVCENIGEFVFFTRRRQYLSLARVSIT